jgi:HD domain/GAF domain
MEAFAGVSDDGSQDDLAARPGCARGASAVLDRIAALACRVSGAEESVLLLHGQGRAHALVTVAAHAPSRALRSQTTWLGDRGVVRRALASGMPAAESGHGRRLSAAAPILIGSETRGVLAVRTGRTGRPFDPHQLDMLADLADLAASTLDELDLRVRAAAVLEAGVEVLARAVDVRDDYTGRHSTNVGELARRVGERLGMKEDELGTLECAARLHDVGKLGVPDAILQKPGPLDDREWAVMRRHPIWGAEMVSRMPGLEDLAVLVRAHHERWDGRGYPHGLQGPRIPLAARVIGACDAFEAMVSRRPYRKPLSVGEALAELVTAAGSQFDPRVVEALEAEVALRA